MNFIFPDHCCSCMGPSETTVEITKVKSYVGLLETFSIHVPICNKCKKEIYDDQEERKVKLIFILSIIGFVLGAAIAALVKTDFISDNLFWEAVGGGVIVGGVGLLLGYLVSLRSEEDFPVKMEVEGSQNNVRLRFKNQEFNQLFHSMNYR